MLKNKSWYSNTEAFHRHEDGEVVERKGRDGGKRDEKKEENMQAFLRTVFVESGCLRFISHYPWVLSQA